MKDKKIEAFICSLYHPLVDGLSRDINLPSRLYLHWGWFVNSLEERTGERALEVCVEVSTIAAVEITSRFGRCGPRYRNIALGDYLTKVMRLFILREQHWT